MNKSAPLFLKGIIIFLTFFSCNKKNEDKCSPTDKYLFYMYMSKKSGILTSKLYDTTAFYSNVYKSNAGNEMPVLKINGRNIHLDDDGGNGCNSGAKFASKDEIIPNIQQTGYFPLGQNNIIELTGNRCGYINEQFNLPEETKLKPLSSNIIHKNQDLVLEFIGGNDYPIETLNNEDPSLFFDQINFSITYSWPNSDTISYPSLPKEQMAGIGWQFPSAGTHQLRIPASQLQSLPVNGAAILRFSRSTQFKLPNRAKGEFFIQLRQFQAEVVTIKN